VYKQCKFIRPNFLTDADPVFVVYAYYDYRTSEVAGSGSSGTPDTGSLWDTGLWDDAIWGFEFPEPHNQLLGGSGIGRSVAIALYGSSASQTDLASVDVMWETGGLM
jgi:hypothetical protein